MPHFFDDFDCWDVDVSLVDVERTQNVYGINIVRLTGEQVEELYSDHDQLTAVMWVVCAEQAQQCGISLDEFCDRLGNHHVKLAAIQALLDSLADFHLLPEAARQMREMNKELWEAWGKKLSRDITKRNGSGVSAEFLEELEANTAKRFNMATCDYLNEVRRAFFDNLGDLQGVLGDVDAAMEKFLERLKA